MIFLILGFVSCLSLAFGGILNLDKRNKVEVFGILGLSLIVILSLIFLYLN